MPTLADRLRAAARESTCNGNGWVRFAAHEAQDCADALESLDSLTRERDAAIALLRRYSFCSTCGFCAVCDHECQEMHKPDCPLAAVLASQPADEGDTKEGV